MNFADQRRAIAFGKCDCPADQRGAGVSYNPAMPELPEVERVRLSLSPIVGRTVEAVDVRRADVVTFDAADDEERDATNESSYNLEIAAKLLLGRRIGSIERLGKQLAIVAATDAINNPARNGRSAVVASDPPTPCVCIHLGMTGSLILHRRASRTTTKRRVNGHRGRRTTSNEVDHPANSASVAELPPHTHIVWRLSGDIDDAGGGTGDETGGGGELHFRDPRRFGGVWPFASSDDLLTRRWRHLGTDALAIQPRRLHAALQRTRRAIKAALLDQHVIAGLGNIYVDETLFRCRLHPLTPADELTLPTVQRLVASMRRVLRAAIAAGGSSLRDYVDGNGAAGGFQHRHQVYGRAEQPCRRCRDPLAAALIAGRTTVFCPTCQPASSVLVRKR